VLNWHSSGVRLLSGVIRQQTDVVYESLHNQAVLMQLCPSVVADVNKSQHAALAHGCVPMPCVCRLPQFPMVGGTKSFCVEH
jgi:hypothetical protein